MNKQLKGVISRWSLDDQHRISGTLCFYDGAPSANLVIGKNITTSKVLRIFNRFDSTIVETQHSYYVLV